VALRTPLLLMLKLVPTLMPPILSSVAAVNSNLGLLPKLPEKLKPSPVPIVIALILVSLSSTYSFDVAVCLSFSSLGVGTVKDPFIVTVSAKVAFPVTDKFLVVIVSRTPKLPPTFNC